MPSLQVAVRHGARVHAYISNNTCAVRNSTQVAWSAETTAIMHEFLSCLLCQKCMYGDHTLPTEHAINGEC